MLNEAAAATGRARLAALFFVGAMLAGLVVAQPPLRAQTGSDDNVAGPSAPPIAPAASDPSAAPGAAPAAAAPKQTQGLSLLTLLFSGGALMIPIVLMSLLVVAFVIERFLGLRRSRVLPNALVDGLGSLTTGPKGGFDPRKAYRLCQENPSAAANVIRAMLLKVGRPHSEVEHTVAEASEREADRIYANVRWLNLAAAVTPLMGLFGTVWGMILSFHETTVLLPGQNKADFLAKGIYVALVTTLGGLAVAIPAAIFSHYFEGRITSLFHEVDELLFNLMPQLERFEGRVRFSRQPGEDFDGGDGTMGSAGSETPPIAATTPK